MIVKRDIENSTSKIKIIGDFLINKKQTYTLISWMFIKQLELMIPIKIR